MKLIRIKMPDPSLRISIRKGCTIYFIPLEEILYCCSQGNYICIHLTSGEKLVSSRNLTSVMEELTPNGFFLIHKSYLVNIMHIRGFSTNGQPNIILTGNIKLRISRRRKIILQELLKPGVNRYS